MKSEKWKIQVSFAKFKTKSEKWKIRYSLFLPIGPSLKGQTCIFHFSFFHFSLKTWQLYTSRQVTLSQTIYNCLSKCESRLNKNNYIKFPTVPLLPSALSFQGARGKLASCIAGDICSTCRWIISETTKNPRVCGAPKARHLKGRSVRAVIKMQDVTERRRCDTYILTSL